MRLLDYQDNVTRNSNSSWDNKDRSMPCSFIERKYYVCVCACVRACMCACDPEYICDSLDVICISQVLQNYYVAKFLFKCKCLNQVHAGHCLYVCLCVYTYLCTHLCVHMSGNFSIWAWACIDCSKWKSVTNISKLHVL